MGSYIALSIVYFLFSFSTAKSDTADEMLKKLSLKLSTQKSITYYQKRIINNPMVRETSIYEGEVHLDYRYPGSGLDCRFQFQNEQFLLVFNGSEDFECDKVSKTLIIKKPEESLFNGYSFLNNSLYTLRKALPGIIENKNIIKSIGDTIVDNIPLIRISFSMQENLIDNLGDIKPIDKGLETRYQLLVDKQNYLPYLFIRQNNRNKYSVKVFFTQIKEADQSPPDSSWFYSNYQKEYKLVAEEKFNLILPNSDVKDWKLPLIGSAGQVSLNSDYKGKFVLMEFWIRNCSYCISAVDVLNGMQKLYGKEKLAIVGINIHDPENRITDFIQQYQVAYPVVSGGDDVRRSLGVGAYPTVVLVGPNRKVIHAGILDKAILQKVLKDNL